MLHFLTDEGKEEAQKKGYMCEHLLCLYSMTADRTALYNNNFPVYFTSYGEADVILFGLAKKDEDKLTCVQELLELPLRELNIVSPATMTDLVGIESKYVDWDYHINVEQFDLDLKGKQYKNLRNRVNQAEKKGYYTRFGRTYTSNHAYILSRHIARHTLDIWDLEELLSLDRFFKEHSHSYMMEAYHQDKLIGFDVVDFLEENKIMVVPLGIYLEEPSLADFLMYENLRHAQNKGYKWLDIGLTCRNVGLQGFKEKWLAKPKYKVSVRTIQVQQ